MKKFLGFVLAILAVVSLSVSTYSMVAVTQYLNIDRGSYTTGSNGEAEYKVIMPEKQCTAFVYIDKTLYTSYSGNITIREVGENGVMIECNGKQAIYFNATIRIFS